MTKKDSVELIVKVLRDSKPFRCTPEEEDSNYNYEEDGYNPERENLFNEITNNFIHELALMNPKFNESKFRDMINS